MKKINVITLGCSKNTVDSEHLMAQLAEAGYTITFDSDSTDAKVVVINTCGFIGDAKQESIDTILSAVAATRREATLQRGAPMCLQERTSPTLQFSSIPLSAARCGRVAHSREQLRRFWVSGAPMLM